MEIAIIWSGLNADELTAKARKAYGKTVWIKTACRIAGSCYIPLLSRTVIAAFHDSCSFQWH